MDTATILKQCALFQDLGDEELDAVTKCVVTHHFGPDDIVIEEGTPGESLYIVASGKLRVQKQSGDKTLVLAELEAGQAFGEMSLIDSTPTSATVLAEEDTDLLAISRLDVNVLLNWDTQLAAKVWKSFTHMLSMRLREMNERMADKFGAAAFSEE